MRWWVGGIGVIAALGGASPASADEPLALDKAIELALKNNPTLVIVKQDLETARAQVRFEEGAFAMRLGADLTLRYDDLAGSAISTASKNKELLAGVGVLGRLRTGMTYDLKLTTDIDELEPSPAYSPFFATGLQLQLAQPLLRNAWSGVNEAGIRIASARRDASEYLRRAQVERVISDVEVAYWSLVLARKKLEIRREGVRLAEQQVELSQKRLKHGAIAPIDAIEAQSEVAKQSEQIPLATQEVAIAEGRLLALLQPVEARTEEALIDYAPTTAPDQVAPLGKVEEYLAAAEKNRPDLAAARSDIQAAEVSLEVAKNQLMPSLDVVASAGLGGISGTFVGARASSLDPDRDLEGGYLDTFKNFRHPNAAVGLRFEVFLDNAQAEAQQQISEADILRRKAAADALKIQIRNEVITAYKQLAADLELVKATGETVSLGEKFLEGQKKLFNEGVGVSFDVFRATSALIRARIARLRAEVRARISAARLSFVQGIYLESHKVQLEK